MNDRALTGQGISQTLLASLAREGEGEKRGEETPLYEIRVSSRPALLAARNRHAVELLPQSHGRRLDRHEIVLCVLFVLVPVISAESVPRGRGHPQRRVAEHGGCGAIPAVHPR